jgi:hypothetical protein
MFTKPLHYGKEISQLSEKETNLLEIDTALVLMFRKIDELENEFEKKMMLQISNQFSDKRVEVCSELLESPYTDEPHFLDFIETTRYAFTKFLRDVDKNLNMFKEQEMLSMLN